MDEAANRVYFSGNRGNAGERHLYAASLLPEQTGTLVQLTSEAGFHTATVNPEKGYVADCFSSVTTPLTMRLYALDTVDTTQSLRLIGTVTDSAVTDTRLTAQRLRESLVTPVFHTIRSTDDKVDLHCAVYLPKGVTFDPSSGKPCDVDCWCLIASIAQPSGRHELMFCHSYLSALLCCAVLGIFFAVLRRPRCCAGHDIPFDLCAILAVKVTLP